RRRPRKEKASLLLTNDDGIRSVGLHELARVLAKRYSVLVVAPDDQRSGAGTGIGFFDPVGGVTVEPVDIGDFPAYSIAGPPGLVGPGSTAGSTAGHSVAPSGTVGAVLTARTFGTSGLAVSLAESDPWRWDTAAAVADAVVEWMLAESPGLMTLNLNVPARDLSDLKGLRWAELDEFGYFRVAIADLPGQRLQFEVGAPDSGVDPASDTALLGYGFATLTPLTSVETTPFPAGIPDLGSR